MPPEPSLKELSENHLEIKARLNRDGSIQTEVSSVTLYPFENNYHLVIHLGKPFNDRFVRFSLGKTRVQAFEKLFELYPSPFPGLDYLEMNSVDIQFDTPFGTHDLLKTPEAADIETSIQLNGNLATLTEAFTGPEYGFNNRDDFKQIQTTISNHIKLYEQIQNTLQKTHSEVHIGDVTPTTSNEIIAYIDSLSPHTQLPIKIQLPTVDTVQDNTVTKFLNAIASGSPNNLQDSYAYLTKNNKVGTDTIFEKYSLTHKTPTKPSHWLQKLF